jgi:mannose-6-phosphate isomerase-like protein (cupin superfamily)
MSRFRRRVPFRRGLVLGVLAVSMIGGAVVAVVASATPPAGVAGPILSRGTVTEDVVIGNPVRKTVTRKVKFRVRGERVTRRVKVKVRAVRKLIACSVATPCDTAFQQVTINPGGHTGWHTHPGPTFVAVAAGEGTLYHGGAAGSGCSGHKYGVGSGFFQPSEDVHTLWNEGSVPLVVHAMYVLPPGTPSTAIRTDQPQPPNCPTIP